MWLLVLIFAVHLSVLSLQTTYLVKHKDDYNFTMSFDRL